MDAPASLVAAVDLGDAIAVLVMLFRIAFAVWLFARGLTARPHAKFVVATVFAACFFSYLFFVSLGDSADSSLFYGIDTLLLIYGIAIAVFSLIMAACVVVLVLATDASVWVALFCTTAGYTLQNLATGLTELFSELGDAAGLVTSSGAVWWFNELVPFCVVCPLCYVAVIRKIDANGLARIDDRSMLLMMPVVSLVIVGYDLVIKSVADVEIGLFYIVLLRLLHALACCFVIWMEYELLYQRHLQTEMRTTERLLAERGWQYEQSRQNINAINLHYHGIREELYQLGLGADPDAAAAGACATAGGEGIVQGELAPVTVDPARLRELTRRLSAYDAVAHTRCEALDTVLTEKSLVCAAQGIGFSYMADGAALSFMAAADVYALASGLVDEAMGAVALLGPHERAISFSVRSALGGAAIHVECPAATVNPGDSAPSGAQSGVTDAASPEARALRETAQRYGGTFAEVATGATHTWDVFIPEP